MNYQELTDMLHGLRARRVEDIRYGAQKRILYLTTRRNALITAGQVITDEEKTNEIIEQHRMTIMSCCNWLTINGFEE